jgi:N4-(beta-N-acetylglucosaminyl)-L-asparaginase
MTDRRSFLKLSALGSGAALFGACATNKTALKEPKLAPELVKPVVVSTWNHGLAANAKAWELLLKGESALDAVEAGVKVSESDPNTMSVGLGGLPDRDGKVTLDACIMNAEGDCGAVAFLQHIENPISVARLVLEKTPHVMLVGQGALDFALDNGFKKRELLTKKSKAAWKKWLKKSQYKAVINRENQKRKHDTIGMLALDSKLNLSGACTTSGMAYKLHGRVGDSPIIGAGLFVDNDIGAACATGVGEAVIRVCGSHLVVELMRQGHEPEQACKLAVERIIKKHKSVNGLQVGFLALRKDGLAAAYSIYKGFQYALSSKQQNKLIDARFDRNW